ncbi:MAG: glucosamine-6-phosphate deaminase [Chloroflexota bacterium]|nr:glucosamine-6-phosphate deaminase [Chloroflexota bacterium]
MSNAPIRETQIKNLPISIYESNEAMGRAAAAEAAIIIRQAIEEKGRANIIVATGNSQLSFLAALRGMPAIDWSKISVFHMDEYVGIDPQHPASFPLFLHRHLVDHVQPGAFYPVGGRADDTDAICRDYEALLRSNPADLVAMGIGENGHIAFNDPPYADFDDPVWVKVVKLDEKSRRQQVGEGHFASLDEVPTHAVTLTIPALLAPENVLCIVPEARKAEAVRDALRGPITEDCPASILRQQPNVHLFLDADAAALAFPVDA